MGNARYLVAKYVPDVFRNEPVNIGVLTWIDGKVAFKFLGQRADGSINGKAQGVTGRIKSVQNYKQWVENWVARLKEDKIQTRAHGTVLHESPDFLTALATYGYGNYLLEPGGELLDDALPSEVDDVTEYLFSTLVGTPEEKEQYKSPDEVRDGLIRDANVQMDERVKTDWPVPLQLRGKTIKPKFNLYIGNGTPELLAQMVPLTSHPRAVQNSARAAEFLFDHVLREGMLPQDRCIAFVYYKEDEQDEDLISETLDELSSVATIVNITNDRQGAVGSIRNWVASAHKH